MTVKPDIKIERGLEAVDKKTRKRVANQRGKASYGCGRKSN